MLIILALALSASLAAEPQQVASAQPAKRPAVEAAAPKKPPPESLKRACLSATETREAVTVRKLVAPYLALRQAATRGRGETIGIKLCRLGDPLVYDVTVLRRDGRVVKVIMDAASGHVLHMINDR